ncbi:hypothetical protein OSL25_26360, partial [Escherichia coli]|nr:hypothetical protein [Escherichia coli]MDA6930640.1 hypothetical protein [Escherichia coli]
SGSGKHFTTVNDHHPCSDSGCFREKKSTGCWRYNDNTFTEWVRDRTHPSGAKVKETDYVQ